MDSVKWFDRVGEVHFYVGIEQGFYEREGISLQVVTGIPSYASAKYVSLDLNALDSFGQADSSIMVQARAEGQPVVCVGAIMSNVVALAALRETKLRHPRDLEGKRVGVSQGSGEAMLLPVLASMNGVDLNTMRVIYLGPGKGGTIEQGPQALVSGELDVYGGYVTGSLQDARYLARQRGTDVDFLRFSDFGFEAYELCLLCNERLAAERPDLLGRFVRSSFRAVAWVADNPDAAAAILARRHPNVPLELARMIVGAIGDSLRRPEVTANGLGWMDGNQWSRLQDQLYEQGRIVTRTDVSALFTNEFLERGLRPRSWSSERPPVASREE